MRLVSIQLLVGGMLWTAAPVLAQREPLPDVSGLFEKTEAMIPMRDGVKLNTEVFVPKGTHPTLPFVLTRTPYGLSHDPKGFSPALSTAYKELADDGYIFVMQDIRGRFKSQGAFEMLRPPRDPKHPKAIDESTDTYDTIEWLLKNVPNNNGRVGMLGVSYGGWLTVMGMLDPHPALKAVSPQASPADMFLGDDFHHNGAFRLSYAWEYAAAMESSKEVTPFKFGTKDTYDWYLALGPLVSLEEKFGGGRLPSWVNFKNHPNYDAFWKRQGFAPYLNRVTVPTLNVAGWWDQEDFYGPIRIYELLEKHDDKNQNYLVVGPWNHGGWDDRDGSSLGKVKFGMPTAKYFRERIQAPWFAYFLKDKGKLDQPEALVFETGSNQWMRRSSWNVNEPQNAKRIYFQSGGKLSFTPPEGGAEAQAFDKYVSDPANPVPYRKRPIDATMDFSSWPVWLVQDQRFLKGRADVLNYTSDPLTDDLVVAGDIVAHLYAATSGTDSDWIVKLIDVYPDRNPADSEMAGFELMIANDVLRGRFRQSFDHPTAIAANQVTPYTIDLHTNDHRFLKGHRIMVQIQSSWFPIIDRNPQTFTPNIFTARASDYRAATQRVYHTSKYPSHIALATP